MNQLFTARSVLIDVIMGNSVMNEDHQPCEQDGICLYFKKFSQLRLIFRKCNKISKLTISFRYFAIISPHIKPRIPYHNYIPYQFESYHDLTSVTFIPAFIAASIPSSASSNTSMNSGSICISSAHLRKVSG